MICVPASATQNIIFTDWNADRAYVGTFNITGSTPSDNWKFVIPSTETGIIYKLYSMSETSVKDTNTSTSSAVLEASNLSDGQYYILQMIPSVKITQYDINNVSSNVEFVLSNSTPVTNISFTLNAVTSGRIYKLYNPTTYEVLGSGIATTTNVTINATGLPDGLYRIAEVGAENVQFTYWNQSNATCNGIFSISHSTPVSNVNITITSNGQGNRYVVYTIPSYAKIAEGTISGTENTVTMFGEADGEYRIARVGTERILFSFWNTSSYPIIGTFQLTNSTPFSIFNLSILNSTRGNTYGLNISGSNTTVEQQYAYSRLTSLIHTGLADGVYDVVILSEESSSFIKGIGTFVAVSFVVGAGYFWDRFRKKNRRT